MTVDTEQAGLALGVDIAATAAGSGMVGNAFASRDAPLRRCSGRAQLQEFARTGIDSNTVRGSGKETLTVVPYPYLTTSRSGSSSPTPELPTNHPRCQLRPNRYTVAGGGPPDAPIAWPPCLRRKSQAASILSLQRLSARNDPNPGRDNHRVRTSCCTCHLEAGQCLVDCNAINA